LIDAVQTPISLGRDPRLSTRTRIITKLKITFMYTAIPPWPVGELFCPFKKADFALRPKGEDLNPCGGVPPNGKMPF
jgi:hypothetical protein